MFDSLPAFSEAPSFTDRNEFSIPCQRHYFNETAGYTCLVGIQEDRLPHLSRMALDYLSIPGM